MIKAASNIAASSRGLAGKALVLAVLVVSGCADRQVELRTTPVQMARWHAGRLVNGDFHPREDGPVYATEPHHLAQLVAMGQDAGPVLLELLRSDAATPFIYTDQLVFAPQHLSGEVNAHDATVADLADWGLRSIYATDVGFRSHLPAETRTKTIRRWSAIVASPTRPVPPSSQSR